MVLYLNISRSGLLYVVALSVTLWPCVLILLQYLICTTIVCTLKLLLNQTLYLCYSSPWLLSLNWMLLAARSDLSLSLNCFLPVASPDFYLQSLKYAFWLPPELTPPDFVYTTFLAFDLSVRYGHRTFFVAWHGTIGFYIKIWGNQTLVSPLP